MGRGETLRKWCHPRGPRPSGPLQQPFDFSREFFVVLHVCDNNQHAVSTARAQALAPQLLSDLAKPFGIPGTTVDGMDVLAVREAAGAFARHARDGQGPAFLECISHRFATHSTATRETRPAAEVARFAELCPIRRYAARLAAEGRLSPELHRRLEDEAEAAAEAALCFADAAPYPDASEALTDVA